MFVNLFRRTEHNITVIAEFKLSHNSEKTIARLSKYIHSIIRKNTTILTDLQVFSSTGYRLTYKIKYYNSLFNRKNYTKELSKLIDWFGKDIECTSCLSHYYYNYN